MFCHSFIPPFLFLIQTPTTMSSPVIRPVELSFTPHFLLLLSQVMCNSGELPVTNAKRMKHFYEVSILPPDCFYFL